MRVGKNIFVGRKSLQYYNGLLIKADLGLHDQIVSLLLAQLPSGSKVLDFGAGEGALSARLKDAGYNVSAADKDSDSFKVDGVPFSCVDFDNPEAVDTYTLHNSNIYDAVIGVEVIEHVQDPWKYTRQLTQMAKPGGIILISTPNTTSWLSRAIFFLNGHFHQFSAGDLSYGHISPITSYELSLVFEAAGCTDVKTQPAGTLPTIFLPGFSLVSFLCIATLPFRWIMRGNVNGWCIIATGKKRS